ncbi:hypothetical protein J4573_41680 [Actinomadura barringtoniae]|uniref:ABC transporter substrate-binding protein n=1 Tax=Actinomadura barringtoniae TaxID=1427535 RepID=A0A939PK84_9ACTN|nr:hypothetical protein [Actinomadura barringtoniae]MBO2453658.1 hypothetical protein [Actinomadura barringtoniae]
MRKFIVRLCALTVALLTVVALSVNPASARQAAAAPAPLDRVPVTGTASDGSTFTGTVVPTAFAGQDRTMTLNGVLSGTLRDASGTTTAVPDQPVSLPVQLDRTCPILHLTLGPLDLNLLGLKVHLDRVVLDITAISGPGNLLGNLLCAIADILNGTGSTTGLAALIAQLNALLGLGR